MVWLILMIMYPLIDCEDQPDVEREKKLISTFQIVRFPNDVCIGSSTRNGTCYTSAECSDKGGTSSGSCADGFGVCCVFIVTSCGTSSSENNTYWTTPTSLSTSTTSCELTVCPMNDDICSIRLDFTSFTITGPSTLTTVQTSRIAGAPMGNVEDNTGVVAGANYATNCLLDAFYVTSASSSAAPPSICGVNTGFHMYTDADTDRCNRLIFTLAAYASSGNAVQNTLGATTLATRAWDIAATQIECASPVAPPSGCTQYFYGGGSYVLQSYNHQRSGTDTVDSTHLANQHQRICIRRERGKCVGCFYAGAEEFAISGENDIANSWTGQGSCCAYTRNKGEDRFNIAVAELPNSGGVAFANGVTGLGFDCVVIPGAFAPGNQNSEPNEVWIAQTAAMISQFLKDTPTANTFPTPAGPQICGNGASLGIGGANFVEAAHDGAISGYAGGANDVTICSRVSPYVLEFISDDFEDGGAIDGEAFIANQATNQGLNIQHSQIDC